MDGYRLAVLAPMIGLAVDAAVHVLLAWTTSATPYRCLTVGFLTGSAALLVASLVAARGGGVVADGYGWLGAMNGLCYLALAFGYFNFVNLAIASLRIRMLEELVASGGRLPLRRLEDSYGTDRMIGLRIDRLLRGGHLRDEAGRLVSGRRPFLVVARVFDGLRWMILGSRAPQAARLDFTGSDCGDRRP